MTVLLAIDTATDACSMALWLDGRVIQRHVVQPRQHVQLVLPMLQELLREGSLNLSQLDALVLGAGPGSFTGLRIAAGLVQGLAFGLNIPVVRISTLHTIAQGLYRENKLDTDKNKVTVTLDAGMGQVYRGKYALGSEGLMQVAEKDRLYNKVQTQDQDKNTKEDRNYPQAQYLVELGYAAFRAGQAVRAEDAQPLYLRPWSGVIAT